MKAASHGGKERITDKGCFGQETEAAKQHTRPKGGPIMLKRFVSNLVDCAMKSILATTVVMLVWAAAGVHAAVNQATDPGGGGVSLNDSGNVTVNSSTL